MGRTVPLDADSATLATMKIREPVPEGGRFAGGLAEDMGKRTEEWRVSARTISIRVAVGAIVCALLCGVVFALGFIGFATSVALSEAPVSPNADGIVALTGGRDRVLEAVELLQSGRGRRLLISGVHPQTRAVDIQRLTESNRALFNCCVDLGRTAETTAGNALEAAEWARTHGFSSLIVVTSAYHMPRSLVELDRVLPNVRKIPFPVAHQDLALDRWYLRPATAKLLFFEYVKYMIARFAPATPRLHSSVPAGGAGDRSRTVELPRIP